MPQKSFLAFACAHLTDERLYAAQVAALHGDYECTVFAFRHEAMAGRVPGARLEIIEDCGHLSTIEQPEAVTRVLRNWLQETEAGSIAR